MTIFIWVKELQRIVIQFHVYSLKSMRVKPHIQDVTRKKIFCWKNRTELTKMLRILYKSLKTLPKMQRSSSILRSAG